MIPFVAISSGLMSEVSARRIAAEAVRLSEQQMDRTELIATLEEEMFQAAEELDFERAARLRDRIKKLQAAPELTRRDAVAEPMARSRAKSGNGPDRGGGRSVTGRQRDR